MAEPGTNYISIHNRDKLKSNRVYSKTRQFYTGLNDWSSLMAEPGMSYISLRNYQKLKNNRMYSKQRQPMIGFSRISPV